MKHRVILRLFLNLIILIVTTLAMGSQAHAEDTQRPGSCNTTSIKGAYGMSLTGSYQGVSYAISGRFVSDGQGHLVGSATQSVGGGIGRDGFTAEYQVNSDCTGSALLTFNGGATSGLDFTLVSNGHEVFLIDTDPGTVETGTAKLQVDSRL
jgi:hypothetical protein